MNTGPQTMELRRLSSFVGVADELHLGRAAELLHVAQPALSEQVRKLRAASRTLEQRPPIASEGSVLAA
jgi:Bacterial regulatory helix-turn-helix protein, lysR family